MKRAFLFARRNAKEILRDPLNLCFGLGFPLILLILLSIINANIPAEANNPMFEIDNLAPGLVMFGTAFMALFAGMLLATDRKTSFLTRLFSSPLRAADFLLGYSLPLLVIAAAQSLITLLFALIFGLGFSVNLLLAVVVAAISSIFFIALGLLCGTLLNDKAVGGVCGALTTNLAGWLSGVFIPIELIGGGFATVCKVLPFFRAVEAIKSAISGDFAGILVNLGIVLAYSLVIYCLAVVFFRKKMRN